MNTFTCVILACNEIEMLKKNINNCKKYSSITEIIVIDDYSHDGTKKILENMGIRVIQNHYCDPVSQREVALEYVNNDWIIFLDADEFVSDRLMNNLTSMPISVNTQYFFIRSNVVFNKILRHGVWYPDYQERLMYRKDRKIILKKTVKGALYHYSHNTLFEWWTKYVRATTAIAKSGKKKYVRKVTIKEVLHMLITKRGYRDGLVGVITILYLYVFEWTIYFKRLRCMRRL